MTENVTQTVPVSHEEVRLEREPVTGANRGAATSGTVTEDHEVSETLRKEQIDDPDVSTTGTTR